MTPSQPPTNKQTRLRGRVSDLPRLLAGWRCLDVAAAELQKVAAADETRARRAFAHALEMREAIDRTFRALAAGAAPPDEDLRLIRDEALEALRAASLIRMGDRFD